jgi:CRP/FNR family cyclic AMP-dependent transcriptional regulator
VKRRGAERPGEGSEEVMSGMEVEDLTIIEGIEKIQEGFLFRGLSFDETRMVARISELVEKRDGDTIIEENAIGEGLYLIVSGAARVLHEEKTISELGEGELFGEMSLIDDVLTSARVVAVGDSRLLKIAKLDLDRLMKEEDRLATKIYRSFCMVLADRLRKADRMMRGVGDNG